MSKHSRIAVPKRLVLGMQIGDYGIQPRDPKVFKCAPTLAELVYAFFERDSEGSFLFPEYILSVLLNPKKGELTSTFLRDGREAVVGPENITFDGNKWVAEGGKVYKVELPPTGWVVEYDPLTGFPSRTSPNRRDAERVFGGFASFFDYFPSGLRAVTRDRWIPAYGPFAIYAVLQPDDNYSFIGVRPVTRLEREDPDYFGLLAAQFLPYIQTEKLCEELSRRLNQLQK